MKKGEPSLSWKAFWSMIGPAFRGTFWSYIGILFLIAVAASAQVAEPIIFGRIVDSIVLGSNQLIPRTVPILGLWVAAFFVNIVLFQCAQWFSWRIGHKVNGAFFSIMMGKVMFWDPDRFGRESVGAITKRIEEAWGRSFDVASRGLTDVIPQTIAFVIVLIAGLFLDWRMTVASLAMVPVVAFVTFRVYRRTDKRQDTLALSWENLSTEVHEILSNILPIKIFCGEDRALRGIMSKTADVARRQIAIDKVWGMLGAGNSLIRLCARLIVISVGIFFISRGEITFGVLTAFLGMLNQLLSPFDYLFADVLRRARRAQSAFARLSKDWDEKNLIEEVSSPVRLRNVEGAISFENVSYRYPGKSQYALRNISLTVPAGKSLALVGRSGSGKSTLVKFVNRFLDPLSGAVTIDGIDLRQAKIQDVRRSVGVV